MVKKSTSAPKASQKKRWLVDQLLPQAQKKFGEDSVSLDSLGPIKDYIDTGCFALNTAIGRPGIPSGRLTVIQGKESSGKSSIAYSIMSECQKRGGYTIYLETESAIEEDRLATFGLYTNKYVNELDLDVIPLVPLHPTHILEAFAMIEYWAKKIREEDTESPIVIVWDSVAATPTTAEAADANESYTSIQPGLAARQVSQGFRRLTRIIDTTQVALICLNFIKEKIGQMFPGADNTATIAQKPLGQHASVRIVLNTTGSVGEKRSKSIGIKVLAKVNKNKVAPPHREAEFNLIYSKGIDNEGSMLDMAKARGIVKSSGGFLTFGETKFRRAQWPEVDVHDEICYKLREQVHQEQENALGNWNPNETGEAEDDDEEYGPVPKKVKVEDDE